MNQAKIMGALGIIGLVVVGVLAANWAQNQYAKMTISKPMVAKTE